MTHALERQQESAPADASHNAGAVTRRRQATIVEPHVAALPRLAHPGPRRFVLPDDRLDEGEPLLLHLRVHVALGDVRRHGREAVASGDGVGLDRRGRRGRGGAGVAGAGTATSGGGAGAGAAAMSWGPAGSLSL